jgi:glycosyltransferase involved in cell wall biosynthesis
MNSHPPKLLLYGSLPPPFTGQSAMFVPVVGLFPKEEIYLVNITRFDSTLGNTVYTMLATCWFFLVCRFKTVYFTPSRSMTGFVKDIPLLMLGRWCNKRMIAHLHGANFRSFYENSGMLRPLIRYGYGRVDTAIVLLEEMKGEFRDFPQIKIRVVPNCYDSRFDQPVRGDSSQPMTGDQPNQPFPGEPLRETSIQFNQPIADFPAAERTDAAGKSPLAKSEQVLYLSALMHSKGILEFLEAAAIVLATHETASFVIAGVLWADDSMGLKEIATRVHTRLQALQERFAGRIQYRGLVTGADKIALLTDSSIFVFPSWHPSEALPVSILEAMRTGNAIIATRHNFLPLLVRPENGLLVEPRSGQAIADAILSLSGNREKLCEIQEYNVRHAIENYSLEKYRKNMLEILKPELYSKEVPKN